MAQVDATIAELLAIDARAAIDPSWLLEIADPLLFVRNLSMSSM